MTTSISTLPEGVTIDAEDGAVFLADWRDAIEVSVEGDRVSFYFWPNKADQPSGGGDLQVCTVTLEQAEAFAQAIHKATQLPRLRALGVSV